MSAWFGGWFGDSSAAGGGSCDYPATGDVRRGVSYGSGAYTGTLGLATSPADPASPAYVLSRVLIALGLLSEAGVGGLWPASVDTEPDRPDDCVTLFDTAGVDFGRTSPDQHRTEHHGIQIRVRSGDPDRGWAKAHEIALALDRSITRYSITVGGTSFCIQSVRRGNVIPLRRETRSERRLFVLNALLCYVNEDV